MGTKRPILLEIPEIFSGTVSKDSPTRWMSILFILSTIGLVTVSSLTISRYWIAKKKLDLIEKRHQTKHLKQLLEKVTNRDVIRSNTLTLGTFTLALRQVLGLTTPLPKGVLNMAEIEVVLLCDSVEAREYLENHLVQAKNQMTEVLTLVDRDELMSRGGKRKIKTQIIKNLNKWLPKGKITEVYFSKLILN